LLAFLFARRYLVSKKSTNAIQIISMVSVLAILVGSAGLILVLSVFNGFESKVESLYNNFYPEMVIQPAQGKYMAVDSTLWKGIKSLQAVSAVSLTLEDKTLLSNDKAQVPAVLKGVDADYSRLNNLREYMFNGHYKLQEGDHVFAVLGVAVEQRLGVNPDDVLGGNAITINYPRNRNGSTGSILDDFQSMSVDVSGSFAVQQDFDDKYALVPLAVAQQLFEADGKISAYEIALQKGASTASVQRQLQELAGKNYIVKNRFEQNEALFKVMRTEKWVVYAILTFILLVAAFNIIGSLSMLVLEKRQDIRMLKTMGAENRLIRNIFLSEGLLLTLVGCTLGFVISTGLCLIQVYFKVIKIQGDSFAFSEYPVKLQASDFLLVFVTVMGIGLLASWLPARRAAQVENLVNE